MNFFVLPNAKEDILKKFVTRLFWGTIDFHSRKKNTMEVNGAPELLCFPHSLEYLPLCSTEQRHSYRFGTTWGWVNYDRIFIFGWTIPLSPYILLTRNYASYHRSKAVVQTTYICDAVCEWSFELWFRETPNRWTMVITTELATIVDNKR